MANDEVLVLPSDNKDRFSEGEKEQDTSTDESCYAENNSPPPSISSAIEIDMIDDFSELCGLGGGEGFQTAMTVRNRSSFIQLANRSKKYNDLKIELKCIGLRIVK